MSDVETITETPEKPAPPAPTLEEVAAKVWGTDDKPDVIETPAAEAPKVEEKPSPAPEKASAKILAARNAERRAAAAREQLRTEQAAVEKQRAELTEHTKVAEALKAAKQSPSKALELLGMSPKEFLETLANEHEPSAIAKRESAGAMSEVEKLKAEVEAMKQDVARREREVAQRQHESAYNQATQAFLEEVDSAPDKYPHLIAEYTPAEIAQAARALADRHTAAYIKQHGEPPSNDVIAAHLEDQARARVEQLAERRARIGQKAPSPGQGISNGQTAVKAQPDSGPSPRTLTASQTSTKASTTKPWSQEAADEESLRILRNARR